MERKEKIVNKSIFASKKMIVLIDAALAVIEKSTNKKTEVAVVFHGTHMSPTEFTRAMENIQHDGTKTIHVPDGQVWDVITTCPQVIRMMERKGLVANEPSADESKLLCEHRANSTIPCGTFGHSTAFCF